MQQNKLIRNIERDIYITDDPIVKNITFFVLFSNVNEYADQLICIHYIQ